MEINSSQLPPEIKPKKERKPRQPRQPREPKTLKPRKKREPRDPTTKKTPKTPKKPKKNNGLTEEGATVPKIRKKKAPKKKESKKGKGNKATSKKNCLTATASSFVAGSNLSDFVAVNRNGSPPPLSSEEVVVQPEKKKKPAGAAGTVAKTPREPRKTKKSKKSSLSLPVAGGEGVEISISPSVTTSVSATPVVTVTPKPSHGRQHAQAQVPVPPDQITNELRFRMQRLMRASLGVEDQDAHLVAGCYGTQVEEYLFLSAGSPTDYRRRARQLCYAMCRNGLWLRQTYRPDQLVGLNDELLSRTSKADQKQRVRDHQAKFCRDLMRLLEAGVFQKLNHLNSDARCTNPKCGSLDIIQMGKQICSGDEGQTVFWICRKCGTSGKLAK